MIGCFPRRRFTSPSGAWNWQARGQTTGPDPGLDLTLFERQMFKLRLAIDLQAFQ